MCIFIFQQQFYTKSEKVNKSIHATVPYVTYIGLSRKKIKSLTSKKIIKNQKQANI